MKKTKLFASILSFCFALSVLCFGVYAAQTVNYTIGGTLTYNATGVFVDITGKLYRSTNNSRYGESAVSYASDVKTELDGQSPSLNAVDLEEASTLNRVYTYDNGVGYMEQTGTGTTNLDLQFGANSVTNNESNGKGYAYYVVLNIHNYGQRSVKATIAQDQTANSNTATNTSFTATNASTASATISSGQDGKLVFAIAVTNLTTSSSGDFSYIVSVVEYVAYTVTVDEYDSRGDFYYRTDGENWIAITGTGILGQFTSIEFKADYSGGGNKMAVL